MTSLNQNRLTGAAALLLPLMAGMYILRSSVSTSGSTYLVIVALAVAAILVGLATWTNGQPTGSMAQLIHDTDIAPEGRPGSTRAPDPTNARWDSWQIRGGLQQHTGRVRALLALSVVVTAALLYIWGS